MRRAGFWLGMGAAGGMALVAAGTMSDSANAAETCESGLLWGPGQAEADPLSPPVSAVRWDPDGPGPEREWLIFGGSQFISGINPINYGPVYAWDGGQYRGIGQDAVGAPTTVYAVGNWNGTLVAGGALSPSSHVVSWDGLQWTPVATNIKSGTVKDFLVFRGELVVTGTSDVGEGLRLTNDRISTVMVLRNGQWEPLGPTQRGYGLDLIEYEGDLVVGGGINSPRRPMVSRWNGSEWISMAPAGWSGRELRQFVVFDGRLTAVGWVNVPPSDQRATALVWNGSRWDRLGTDLGSQVYSVAVHDDALWITLPLGLYRWDRRTWEKTLPQDVTEMGFGFTSYPLLTWDGDLLMCGVIIQSVKNAQGIAGYKGTYSLGRLSNGRFQSLAAGLMSQFIATAGTYGGKVFVGGSLSFAGAERSSGLATWDGVNWDVNYRVPGGQVVYGFADHPTGLLAFGTINLMPGSAGTSLPAWGIVRWDGTSWTAFGDASNVTTAGTIQEILVEGNEVLAVRTETSNPPTSSVRRWNGSGWEQLGGVANGSVGSLIRYNGTLIAAGTFTQWDGNSLGRVAQWDGSQWIPFGTGMDNTVSDLAIHQGELFASGYFQNADNQSAIGVAKWSGAKWGPVGSGPSTRLLSSLRSYQGQLFTGGARTEMTPSGSVSSASLERWNGVAWSTVDIGRTGSGSFVSGLSEHNGELLILGSFVQGSGGRETVRRWSSEKNPWVAWQPQSSDTVCGGSTTFRARVANGYAISSAVWYRGSEPVVPDRAAGVRVEFSGGHSTLRLDNVDASDAGQYRCVFTHPCGTVESAPAALTITGSCCPGDMTLDAIVDDADFQSFAAAYDVRDCGLATMLPGCPADLNNDGLVDDADFGEFIAAYDALVCE